MAVLNFFIGAAAPMATCDRRVFGLPTFASLPRLGRHSQDAKR